MSEQRQDALMDLAAERGLLGGLLLHGLDAMSERVTALTPQDFGPNSHQAIFRAIKGMLQDREPLDEMTVASRLHRSGELERAGGPAYLAQLADTVITAAHSDHYAGLVKQSAVLRGIRSICRRTVDTLKRPVPEPDELAAGVQRELMELAQGLNSGRVRTMAEMAPAVMRRYEERARTGRDPRAVATGISRLDRITGGGLKPGQYVICAGRPSMGKTALALKAAAHVALKGGLPVLFAGLEQGAEELTERLVCSQAHVDTKRWATGQLDMLERREAQETSDRLIKAPLHWLCDGVRTLDDITARARRISQEAMGRLGLVVLDYIGLLARDYRYREAELSSISRSIKEAAKELGCPWLVCAQLNRKVEDRVDKRPMLSDLRDSGSLEQDADLVMLLYRPGYYEKDPLDRKAEVNLAKHKNGPTGVIDMLYMAEFTAWENPAGEEGQ